MKKITYILLALIPLLSSCLKETWNDTACREVSFTATTDASVTKASDAALWRELPLEEVQTTVSGDTLRINVCEESFASGAPATKADIYASGALSSDVSLGIIAYKYASTGAAASSWTLHTSPAVLRADYDGTRSGASGKWVPVNRFLWPGTGYVRYFAYAPYGASGATVTAASGTAPTLAFAVDDDYTKQVDLLVADAASTAEKDGNPPVTAIDVPITFEHALTGIRFRVEKGLTVNKITISDVYTKGTLPLDNLSWTGHNTKGSYTITSPTVKTDGNYDILDDEYTLLLLPQTLPVGARISAEVTMTIDEMDFKRTIYAVMDNVTWPSGKLITYTITTLGNVQPTFTIDALQAVTTKYYGETKQLSQTTTFRSFATQPDGTVTPIPFKLQYSTDNSNWTDEKPDWLNASSESGWAGSFSGETLMLSVASQANSRADAHHDAMAALTPADSLDLSTINVATGESVSRTTANCYVVQRPGTYRFPLVYGNGVKNGVTNAAAYTGSSGTNMLSTFLDHLDQEITSPYIATQQSGKELTAELIWSDFPGLIYDVSLTGSGEDTYLCFRVGKEYISHANAVVAVLADGKIAWSWQIWVTDVNLTLVKNSPSGSRFAPVSLGWCDEKEEKYEGRTYFVRAVQTVGGKASNPVKITQNGQTLFASKGNASFYQWGRKDPMLSTNGKKLSSSSPVFSLKTWYPSRAEYSATYVQESASVGMSIQTPYRYYWVQNTTNNHWNLNGDERYYNLWNNDVKTIYDPSPVGYRVPPSAAFNGLIRDNTTWGENATYGIVGRTYNGELFFPAAGYRQSSSVFYYGESGSFWTASERGFAFAHVLFISSTNLHSESAEYAAGAEGSRMHMSRPVLPIVEDAVIPYSYSLTVSAPTGLSAQGGSASNGFVSSYRTNDQSGISEAVAWNISGYYSDAACTTPYDGSNASNKPAWLTSVTTGGSGSAPGASEPLTASVSASSYSTVTQNVATVINNEISGNGIRGSESALGTWPILPLLTVPPL